MRKIYSKCSKSLVLSFAGLSLLLASCKKDNSLRSTPEITGTKGIYVLCEGSWGANNSAITYYDVASNTTIKDYFQQVNGRPLGETANDLQVYGSKMYCVVSGTQNKAQSYVIVMDLATGKSLKSIPFNTANDGYIPRYITFYKNKAYVSRYDGVISRIDTASLSVDKELQLMNGTNKAGGLEGLAVANGKLYVTNSNHSFYPDGLKDKVTVIDLETFTKKTDIAVVFNPVKIAAAENGDLLVVSWGNYDDIDPQLTRINSNTDAVNGTYPYNAGPLAIVKNKAYLVLDWNATLKTFDMVTAALSNNFITDNTSFNAMYGVNINNYDGTVLITDADYSNPSTGQAHVFSADGKKKYSFPTAGSPNHAVFTYNYN